MTRREFDFYPTPSRATEILLDYVPELLWADLFLEPCAGDGAIANVLRKHKPVETFDIDSDQPVDHFEDARFLNIFSVIGYDPLIDYAVVTNPPFIEASEIVYNLVLQGFPCAFLLRLSFLEPTEKRGELLADVPPAGMIVLPRISFTGDGKTDSVTCAWMCWNVEPFGIKVVPKSEFRGEHEI